MNVLSLAAATVTRLAKGGNRDFLHIYNNTGAALYVCYDSDDATALTSLDNTTGISIADQGVYFLNNDGHRNVFNKPVYAYSVAGGEVRVQGDDGIN